MRSAISSRWSSKIFANSAAGGASGNIGSAPAGFVHNGESISLLTRQRYHDGGGYFMQRDAPARVAVRATDAIRGCQTALAFLKIEKMGFVLYKPRHRAAFSSRRVTRQPRHIQSVSLESVPSIHTRRIATPKGGQSVYVLFAIALKRAPFIPHGDRSCEPNFIPLCSITICAVSGTDLW